MTLGPIDILVVEFPGNKFKGEILTDLFDLVEAGTIRIVDLVIVTKNQDGEVEAVELQELQPTTQDALAPLQATISQMITREDIDNIGQNLQNNSTAGMLLYENTWAVKIKQAFIDADARLVMQERIPHEVIEGALADLAALGAPVQ